MSDVEHPHRLPPFIDFIDNPIDVRFLAVKQVSQFSLSLAGLWGNRAA
jgi:hypothetical protein